jgi:MscS family membrane protein
MGPENLSMEPEGHRDDDLPSFRDRVATISTPDGPVDILLQRVPGDNEGDFIWKVSNRTVAEIPRLYELYGYGELGDKLSKLLPHFDDLIVQPWQLVILIGIVLLAFTIAWLLTRIIILFLQRSKTARSERIQSLIAGPARFLIFVVIFRNYFYLSAPSLKVLALFEAKTLYIAAFAWMLIGLSNLLIGRLVDRMEQQGNSNGALILRPANRAIKGIIILITIMVWLDNMGFKISTLLAGLGVGSIAVALAARNLLKTLTVPLLCIQHNRSRLANFVV